jgi:hypothetical protein
VNLRDNQQFVTHEVTARKRYKNASNGERQTLHSYRASELYALQFVLKRAEEHILVLRSTVDCPSDPGKDRPSYGSGTAPCTLCRGAFCRYRF